MLPAASRFSGAPEALRKIAVLTFFAGPAYPDQGPIRIREREFIHAPWFVFGFVKQKIAKRASQRVDLFHVEIQAEGIVSGYEPPLNRLIQMQMRAFSIRQNAIVAVVAVAAEAQSGVEGLAGIEIVAGQDSGEPGCIFHSAADGKSRPGFQGSSHLSEGKIEANRAKIASTVPTVPLHARKHRDPRH